MAQAISTTAPSGSAPTIALRARPRSYALCSRLRSIAIDPQKSAAEAVERPLLPLSKSSVVGERGFVEERRAQHFAVTRRQIVEGGESRGQHFSALGGGFWIVFLRGVSGELGIRRLFAPSATRTERAALPPREGEHPGKERSSRLEVGSARKYLLESELRGVVDVRRIHEPGDERADDR